VLSPASYSQLANRQGIVARWECLEPTVTGGGWRPTRRRQYRPAIL